MKRSDWVAIGIAMLSLLLAGWAGYAHNDKEISNRVAVVETQQKNDSDRLQRMEAKIDRLIEWMANRTAR